MRKLTAILALTCVFSLAHGQAKEPVRPAFFLDGYENPPQAQKPLKEQSFVVDVKEGTIGLTYINDGIDVLAGLSARAYDFGGRFKLLGIAVSNFQSHAKYYAGGLLTYRVWGSPKGIRVDIGAGAKAFDLTRGFEHISFAKQHPWLWSVGITFPF